MKTNTGLVFKILLRQCGVDCVFDIGACDGSESIMFRQVLPKAVVVAFEANPFLYKKMAANPNFHIQGIEFFPYAITNKNGTAPFHVIDLDYDDAATSNPITNPGTGLSSLLASDGGVKIKESVEVQTRRIDEFLLSRHPEVRRVGLWIDAEGAEFEILEGMAGIKERVVAVHVETARIPMRVGQKVYAELEVLMKSLGFVPLATNMSKASIWGDVVFVNEQAMAKLGLRFHLSRWIGQLGLWCRLDSLSRFLRMHCSPLYRILWRIYIKLFT